MFMKHIGLFVCVSLRSVLEYQDCLLVPGGKVPSMSRTAGHRKVEHWPEDMIKKGKLIC